MDFSDIFRTFTSNSLVVDWSKRGSGSGLPEREEELDELSVWISMSYSEFLLLTYLSAVPKSGSEKGNLCSNFLSRFRAIAKYVKILYSVLPCDSIQRFNWTLTMDQRIIC